MYDKHTEMARNCNVFNDHQALSRKIGARRGTERLRSSFSGRGAERWMAHEHGELGIGPGEPGTPAGVNIASPGITDF